MKKNAENGMMGMSAVKAESVRGKVFATVAWVAVSLAVVGMLGGCGLFDEEVTTSIDEKRGDGAVKAILDDSLALVINGRMWEESSESCEHWDNCDYGFINQGLFIVNYRKKQPPYWGDTVNDSFSIPDGLAYDSTLLVYKGNGDFGFWKAGELPDIRKKLKWSDECTGDKNIKAVRPWKKGKILLKKVASCPFAVLDTATGEIKKFEFTGEYAWLDGCDDITYMDGDVMCLR